MALPATKAFPLPLFPPFSCPTTRLAVPPRLGRLPSPLHSPAPAPKSAPQASQANQATGKLRACLSAREACPPSKVTHDDDVNAAQDAALGFNLGNVIKDS